MSWLAVNAREQSQIGHYHLLKRDYETAWKWYQKANAAKKPFVPVNARKQLEQILSPRDSTFFQYYCLKKLNRDAEAQAKLQTFLKRYAPKQLAGIAHPEFDRNNRVGRQLVRVQPRRIADPKSLAAPLLRDLYMAEVFLSLDAYADGKQFFQDALAKATTDRDRLSRSLVLAQFHLLGAEHQQYAELATETILPLSLRMWQPYRGRLFGDAPDVQLEMVRPVGAALLPLYSEEYLAQLDTAHLQQMTQRWQALRNKASDDVEKLAIDLFLKPAHKRLNNVEKMSRAADRLRRNPRRREVLGEQDSPDYLIRCIQCAPSLPEFLRRLLL